MELTALDSVEWHDGTGTVKLPMRWLRFECPCTECRVAQTAERRWVPLEPDHFVPVSVDSTSTGVTVAWSSGHLTSFDAATLRASLAIANRAVIEPTHWAGGGSPDRFDHQQATTDPATMLHFMGTLLSDGTAILTGTPSIPAQLEATMASLALPLRETFSERIHNVFVDPAGYNIAHTNEALPPHSDYPSYTHPPSGQVLHMLVNECAGGQSLVVDGWNAAAQLRAEQPDLFRVLTEVAVPFRQYSDDRESFARAPIIRTDPTGDVTGFRYSNQLMQPLPATHPRFDQWMDAYLELTRILTDPANQRLFRLDSGDALFVHGHRVLHGRTQFVVDGKRHLQDCYFDIDDVLARVDRLSGRAGGKVLGGVA